MPRVVAILVRLAAVFYGAIFAAALYNVIRQNPTSLSPVAVAALAGLAGFVAHVGLFLAPSFHKSRPTTRVLVGLLMFPGFGVLAALFVGGVLDWPRLASVVGTAAVGIAIYGTQYFILWRTAAADDKSASPAV